jgi:hypothetical protein
MRYLDSIKLRIEVRTLAQKKALASAACELSNSAASETRALLDPIAKPILKRMALRGDVRKLFVATDHNSISTFQIEMLNGIVVKIPAPDVLGLPVLLTLQKQRKALARELCGEIKFLHDFIKPSYIASFAAHACRLWVPANKQDRIPPSLLNSLMEDFIVSKRPAVCKVA